MFTEGTEVCVPTACLCDSLVVCRAGANLLSDVCRIAVRRMYAAGLREWLSTLLSLRHLKVALSEIK